MDAADVDPRQLEVALDDVARVNRWLGGTRALLRHLPWALATIPGSAEATATLLDVGTGSADLPRAILGRGDVGPVRIVAVDLHAGTLHVAARRCRGVDRIALARADGLALPFRTGSVRAAVLSMTLHHMEGEAQVSILRELARVARGGRVLVAELERSLPNYLGARLMAATLWRRHPITRHDGPLSVLRSFTPAELLDLATRAGLGSPSVHRHPFYRLVLRAEAT